VQPKRLILPELYQARLQAITRPVRRARHLADEIPGGELRDALFQRKTALQRARLIRRPGAELAAAWARGEIRIGLFVAGLADVAFQAHLALQRFPVEQQGCLGMGAELLALAATIGWFARLKAPRQVRGINMSAPMPGLMKKASFTSVSGKLRPAGLALKSAWTQVWDTDRIAS